MRNTLVRLIQVAAVLAVMLFNASGARAAEPVGDASAIYLLITSDALATAFQPLVDRRTAQGKTGTLITVETIDATYPGADLPEKIRNCVIDHHANHGTQYVCLGGDDTIVPVRNCVANVDYPPAPVELYYSDVDGTEWDGNGNGIYGEIDEITVAEVTPEVPLGRIPVRTGKGATDYFTKLVAYETRSPDGFARSMLTVSNWGTGYTGEGRPDDMRDHEPVRWGEKLYWDYYRHEFQPYWQSLPHHRYHDTFTSWDTAVCGDYGITPTHFEALLNWGYHFVVLHDHGNYYGIPGSLQTDRAAKLTNATRPSIFIAFSCFTAMFDSEVDPCVSEALIRNPNGGAIAYIGYVRSAQFYGPTMDFQREIFQNGRRCIGKALMEMKVRKAPDYVRNTWHTYSLVLLGDPATEIHWDESGRKLQMASPKGCEVAAIGYQYPIVWNAVGLDFAPGERVRLDYSNDGGGTWQAIPGAEALPYDGRTFTWDTSGLPEGNGYRVRVTSVADPAVSDASGRDFTLIQMGLLTVRSTPLANMDIAGTHPGVTNYTRNVVVDDTVQLTAPAEAPNLTFARWADADGNTLSTEPELTFPFTTDATVVAEYDTPSVIAAHYYVNDDEEEDGVAVGDDANDGLTPATPMRHIQELLDKYPTAGWGAIVHVAAGTYVENILMDSGHSGLILAGAGQDVTIIDGDQANYCLQLYGVVEGRVTGFTFRNGNSSAGGGIYCSSGSTTLIAGNRIAENTATYGGGIACFSGASPTIVDNLIEGNTGTYVGGGFYTKEGSAVFEGNTVIGNSAPWGGGGACYNDDGPPPQITGNTITANTASVGGGVRCWKTSAVLTGNVIVSNSATSSGGGISSQLATPQLVSNTIAANAAPQGGGVHSPTAVPGPTIANCILWGNGDDLRNCTATYSCISDGDSGTGNISSY
ncbi:right-handed parallel beta-helix repeat-containing protein, partial [bacterium]|nr:right-handed parallel beta-helix repeat-containing protein [bacterium]